MSFLNFFILKKKISELNESFIISNLLIYTINGLIISSSFFIIIITNIFLIYIYL